MYMTGIYVHNNKERTEKVMMMSNKVYDVLKWITMYLIPAAGTLYFALSSIWGLPYGEQILGTLSAIEIFLATILGISTSKYNKSKE